MSLTEINLSLVCASADRMSAKLMIMSKSGAVNEITQDLLFAC
jgi:hypothetical protein